MKIGAFCLVWAFLVFAGIGFAAEPDAKGLNLELQREGAYLRVTILNMSMHPARLNCRFSIGAEGDWAELDFAVTDRLGKKQSYQHKTNAGKPTATDWCDLTPHHMVGVLVPISEIRSRYELSPGEYTVGVRYTFRDDRGLPVWFITSSPVRVVLPVVR